MGILSSRLRYGACAGGGLSASCLLLSNILGESSAMPALMVFISLTSTVCMLAQVLDSAASSSSRPLPAQLHQGKCLCACYLWPWGAGLAGGRDFLTELIRSHVCCLFM